jgi:hypothetical protein
VRQDLHPEVIEQRRRLLQTQRTTRGMVQCWSRASAWMANRSSIVCSPIRNTSPALHQLLGSLGSRSPSAPFRSPHTCAALACRPRSFPPVEDAPAVSGAREACASAEGSIASRSLSVATSVLTRGSRSNRHDDQQLRTLRSLQESIKAMLV